MSIANGPQILAGLVETRKFLQQVALLIEAADGFLRNAGWSRLHGNRATYIADVKTKPRNWMPEYIFSFFSADKGNKDNKNLGLFVGVLLDREGVWAGFKEPWVTCGLFKFSAEIGTKKFEQKHGWVTVHLKRERDPDGKFYDRKLSPEEQERLDGLVYEASMALPLMSIKGMEDLKQKVIDPLLKQIEKVSGRHE